MNFSQSMYNKVEPRSWARSWLLLTLGQGPRLQKGWAKVSMNILHLTNCQLSPFLDRWLPFFWDEAEETWQRFLISSGIPCQ